MPAFLNHAAALIDFDVHVYVYRAVPRESVEKILEAGCKGMPGLPEVCGVVGRLRSILPDEETARLQFLATDT